VLTKTVGLKHDQLTFHSSFSGPGLSDAKAFRQWLEATLDDWSFECLCTAHNGVLRSNANSRVRHD